MGNLNNVTIDHNNENITFDANTAMDDWSEARYVMEKFCNGCFQWNDFKEFVRHGRNDEAINLPSATSFEGYMQNSGFISTKTKRLQRNISWAS